MRIPTRYAFSSWELEEADNDLDQAVSAVELRVFHGQSIFHY
jgi:hypothetical protein